MASNFNALEGGGTPVRGITAYMNRYTFVQGEAAAVSAMPGLIYRMYFIHQTVNGKSYFGQFEHQLNLLREIPEIPVVNGYPNPTAVKLDKFQNLSAQEYDNFVKKVHIGFQDNIQVTSGLGPLRNDQELNAQGFKAIKINNATQQIAQVFTAAFNLKNNTNSQFKPIARILLDAAYEGTLKAAYAHDKKLVVLTLVGGGAFANDLEWIIDAITKALDYFVNKGDMTIELVMYPSQALQEKGPGLRKKLLAYVNAMGGTYSQFNDQGVYTLTSE